MDNVFNTDVKINHNSYIKLLNDTHVMCNLNLHSYNMKHTVSIKSKSETQIRILKKQEF